MTPTEVLQVAGKPFSEDITLIGGKPFRRWIYKGTVNCEVIFLNNTVFAVLRTAH
jgi:hypothetical protein